VAVKTGEPLIRKLVRNLAVLRYIFQAIPTTDSWHPVFVRYIAQLSNQIAGLGVDPEQIPPSPDDPGLPGQLPPEKVRCIMGKVCEVIFDCFGDFKGFVIEDCSARYHIRSTKVGIEKIVLRACREQLTVMVCLHGERIHEVIVVCA
jgi:hypothetical protein